MAAQLLVLYNTPTDPAAFDRYYRETHTPLAKAIPGVSFSVSDGPVVMPQGGESPYHQIAILAFDSMEALQAGMASPEGRGAAADLRNFAQAGATFLIFEVREA
jgi:uncharacterized protein (TIGR02118 family)